MVDLMELLDPKKRKIGHDGEDEAEAYATDLAAEEEDVSAAEELASVPASTEPVEEAAPQEDLLQALEGRIGELEQQTASYRQMLDKMGLHAQLLTRKADDDAFMQSFRRQYEKDPVEAINTIVRKAQAEVWEAVERHIDCAFRDHRQFKMLLQEFLEDPKNAGLRSHERTIEHLIRDKGVDPKDLGELMRQVEAHSGAKSRLRAAAAKEIRNRSAVETGGEMGEPVDRDKEVDRLIKQSKTLDELFAGLRSLKI